MNVGIVVQDEYPSDGEVRTRKLAKRLDQAGYDVTILARGVDMHAESSLDVGYATVHRFLVARLAAIQWLVTFPVPINPFWFGWTLVQLLRHDFDVVVVGDLRVAAPTILAGRLAGRPVISDLRENYPEYARSLPKRGFAERVFFSPPLVRVIETTTARLADAVWVVVEERKSDITSQGVPSETVSVVMNTPLLGEFDTERRDFETFPDGFVIVYVGELTRFRGLDLAIEAMPTLVQRRDDVHLCVAGDGPDLPRLRRLAEARGVEDHVTFTGWIDAERVPSFLERGDVGVILHEVNQFTDTTVPNKLFDYMQARLPVVATPMAPVSRIVQETECGEVLPPGPTPEELAEMILHIGSRCRASKYGANGAEAISAAYNWESEFDTVVRTIEEVTGT